MTSKVELYQSMLPAKQTEWLVTRTSDISGPLLGYLDKTDTVYMLRKHENMVTVGQFDHWVRSFGYTTNHSPEEPEPRLTVTFISERWQGAFAEHIRGFWSLPEDVRRYVICSIFRTIDRKPKKAFRRKTTQQMLKHIGVKVR